MANPLSQDDLTTLRDWLLGCSAGPGRFLYAILDAGRDETIAKGIREVGGEFVSLYRGGPEETLADVAPYLLKVDRNIIVLEWVLRRGWGKSWGVFLISAAEIEDVRRHLRHFLLVRDPDDKELYFRFYDPRVLTVYLPTCTASEVKRFLGPILAYLSEFQDGRAVLHFSREASRTILIADLTDVSSPARMEQIAAAEVTRRDNSRLRIREEQMQVFAMKARQGFEDRMTTHVHKFFPDLCRELGDKQLQQLIQQGIDRAGSYRIQSERDVCKFIDVMLILGKNFETSAEFPWASQILSDESMHPATKVSRLFESAQAHLESGVSSHG